jgi:hypothetical protein
MRPHIGLSLHRKGISSTRGDEELEGDGQVDSTRRPARKMTVRLFTMNNGEPVKDAVLRHCTITSSMSVEQDEHAHQLLA